MDKILVIDPRKGWGHFVSKMYCYLELSNRKRKLLDKQKKGKSRMKQFGKVEIPQEAFIGVLKINKDQ